MASLVAYDDSDSEAEAEAAESAEAAGQVKGASGVLKPRAQGFASEAPDATEGAALPTQHGSRQDPAGHRLPLARLWRSDPGSCPSQRLQWPGAEPAVTFPPGRPPRPSLWTSHVPAGSVPLAAARSQQAKLSWGAYAFPEPSFCAQTKAAAPGGTGGSLQRKRCEDRVVPYIPKRLRQAEPPSTAAGKSKDPEAQGLSAGRAPAPLPAAPRVSEFIEPYLDSQYRETMIPKKVLFHLRSHRGPVNRIQWCPVSAKSHMLLSASMDKTFKVCPRPLLDLSCLFHRVSLYAACPRSSDPVSGIQAVTERSLLLFLPLLNLQLPCRDTPSGQSRGLCSAEAGTVYPGLGRSSAFFLMGLSSFILCF
uniref:WD repeat domain 25 n=1 Tax=Suricata suricatta TaxID=37032 RepID=A0A673UCG5_SURSU